MLPVCGSTVYGVALNFRAELERLKPPLPVAPVLYLRPCNTWSITGAPIAIPTGVTELKMAGTLGIVIGRELAYIAVNDASIPHESYFRPAIRQRCRDGFCVLGSKTTARLPNEIRTFVNGELRSRASLADLVRPIDRLLSDIGEFLTLSPGDIVLIGEPPASPLAHAGDIVRVEVDGLTPLENQVVLE
jgi:5-oxopent-3-ene-1,2,5-tricarboxylate decarboxylase / 2-hydroxyhepta-2,4-diene-1,7-dioate isomerase